MLILSSFLSQGWLDMYGTHEYQENSSLFLLYKIKCIFDFQLYFNFDVIFFLITNFDFDS